MPSSEFDLIENARQTAFGQVVLSLNRLSIFPSQVFRGEFSEFMFFESDRIFTPSFADIVKEFLSAERSTSCCLVNLSRTHAMVYTEADTIFLEGRTMGVDYDAHLRGGGPATGWLFSMDRYGCASDGGGWSIYCEKDSDLAVIGLRDKRASEMFFTPLRKLRAEKIDTLIEQGTAALFPFSSLSSRWKEELSEQYGN